MKKTNRKSVLHNVIGIIRMEMHINWKLVLFEILLALSRTAESLTRALMPAIAVDMLLYSDIGWGFAVVALFAFTLAVCGFFSKLLMVLLTAYGFQMENRICLKLQQKLMEMPYPYSESADSLKRYSLVRENFYEFMDVDYNIFTELLGAVIGLAAMSGIMARVSPWLFICIAPIAFLDWLMEKKSAEHGHRCDLEKEELLKKKSYLTEIIYETENSKELKMYSAEEMVSGKYEAVSGSLRAIEEKKERRLCVYKVCSELISFLQNAVIYGGAVYRFALSKVTLGNVYIGISSGTYLVNSVKQIMGLLGDINRASLYYTEFEEFMNWEPGTACGTEPIDRLDSIEFRNVSFRYSEDTDYVLKDINFTVKRGEKIALVGDNGAGKSTLTKLIFRLYDPTEGTIYVNGRDVREYRYEDFVKLVAPVFQSVRLMGYSVLENIVFGKEADGRRLEESLEKAKLSERIKGLKKGVCSIVSKDLAEDGIEFSGGEEQKIALARALYKEAALLVLDEPMSALDPMAEREMYRIFQRQLDGKMLVLVSHRIPGIAFCDHILVMEDGRIIEAGSHEELLKAEGKYFEMFQKQSFYYTV